MKAYVFPGQGSQHQGMGCELFGMFPDYVARADAVIGYSLADLCATGGDGRLDRTQYTQPALFAVSALAFLRKVREYAMPPDAFAGHSLGEYCALFAAGAFDFEAGLAIVAKRGELMSRIDGGGMAAVLACSPDRIRGVLREHGLDGLDVANLNAPEQTVLSGPKDQLDRARAPLEAAGSRVVPLAVSAPFHSRYMRDMAEEFGDFLAGFRFNPLRAPVVSNVTARPFGLGETVDLLVQQLYSPVRWVESVSYLMDFGASDIEEVGPGEVLTRLVHQIAAARSQVVAA